MSILKYQIKDSNIGEISVWVDTKLEVVKIQTHEQELECDFNDWQKLTSNIAKDIEVYEESKPKDLFFGYQIVKK
jgi:hypothetical protein